MQRKLIGFISLVLGVLCVVDDARGVITVTASGGAVLVGQPVIEPGVLGAIVTVSAYGTPSGIITVEADGGLDAIERIRIVPQPNPPFSANQLNLSLTVRPKPGTTGAIVYLGVIERIGAAGDLWIGTINVQGSIGNGANPNGVSIVAQSINTIRAGNDIAAAIISTGSAQADGAIALVESTGGRVLGDIKAENANIGFVEAQSTIGTSPTMRSTIWAKNGISKIQGASIYADIQANRNGAGSLTGLYTTGIGSPGDFVGSLTARQVPLRPEGGPFMSLARDLDANITLSGSGAGAGDILSPLVIGRNFVAGRTISAQGSLIDDATANGRINIRRTLAGTIALGNASNDTSLRGPIYVNRETMTGVWTGSVSVGTRTLSPSQPAPNTAPFYQVLPSTLGGGSVELLRVNMHAEASLPKHQAFHNEVGFPPTNPLAAVAIDHYGELFNPNPSHPYPFPLPPVTVQRRPLTAPNDPWETVSTAGFLFSIPDGKPRRLKVQHVEYFHGGFEYRITPVPGRLKAKLVDDGQEGSPVVNIDVRDYEYRFTVVPALGQGGD
jgi:hypothetical protein